MGRNDDGDAGSADPPGSPVSAPERGGPSSGAERVTPLVGSRGAKASSASATHRHFGGVWRWVGRTGWVLITVGVLILLFVAYQLWGTGVFTAREQRALKAEFEERVALEEGKVADSSASEGPASGASPGRAGRDATSTTVVEPTPKPAPARGEPVGLVEIPAIGVEHAVVEGVGVADLRRGPGHYPQTPLPGHRGNAAIAGHRTTYGAPFNELDELEAGDEIRVTTLEGRFTYVVSGREVVDPGAVEVLRSDGGDRLTLTTCNPEYSSRERLVVSAELEGDPISASEATAPSEKASSGPAPSQMRSAEPGPSGGSSVSDGVASSGAVGTVESLDGTHASGFAAVDAATVATGLGVVLVGGAWWWVFHRRRRWTTWLAGVPPFAVMLFLFFVQLEQVLPTSY